MYIIDEGQVENVYNKVKDLTINSFEGKTIIDPAIDIGDALIIDGKKVIYQGEMSLVGRFIADIKSKIDIKQKQETTVKKESQKIINRRIQSEINQIDGKIVQLVEEQTETSNKLTEHEQDINGIRDRVSQIEDLTNEVSGTTTVSLGNCVAGNLLELHIYGNNTVFDYLYPSDNLLPSNDLYPYGDSRIVVTDKDNNSRIYELGIKEVLRQNGEICDEYVLKEGKAQVIRRINPDGTIKTKETIEELGSFAIYLPEGLNTIKIKNYIARLSAKWAIKSDYTDVFATKVEMNASIETKADQINLEVKKKVDENEVISKINMSSEAVGIKSNKIELSANDVLNILAGNEINIKSKNISIKSDNLQIDENGNLICKNGIFNGGNITLIRDGGMDYFVFYDDQSKDNNHKSYIDSRTLGIVSGDYRIDMAVPPVSGGKVEISLTDGTSANTTSIKNSAISTPILNQTSLVENKKNFEKLQNALEIIKQVDIYKYNLKHEQDTTKKHIGFVIGDNYKYSRELTSNNNDGADIYSLASCCLAGIKEQQEEIEELRREVKKLKEMKVNG